MLYDRLQGRRSPGDNAIITPQLHPILGIVHPSRYMTMSTLGSTSVWNSATNNGSMTGTGDGDRTLVSGAYMTDPIRSYGYLSFINFADAALFGFSNDKQIGSAASNGSGDIGVFVKSSSNVPLNSPGAEPTEYINITNSTGAIMGSDTVSMGGGIGATSNGLNDRMLRVNGYSSSSMSYWTISTRSAAMGWGNGIDGYGVYPGNPVTGNDINNRVIWANGVCGENCPTSTIRFSNMTSIGSCTLFGNNTFSSWSPYAISNGVNELAIFGGGTYYWAYTRLNRSYVNISSASNAIAFSDLEVNCGDGTGASSNSRQ